MKEELEDDLYDTKLLPTDGDQSISTTEIAACAPVNSEFPSAKDAEITEKDGGWAWVVCGAAFCDLFVVLGMHYTVGVLYAALLDHFKESKAKTAWVGSIAQFSLFFFCYPGSLLSERYGCRRVVIVGGILTSIGLLLSSFATSLNQIYFTHGIIVGFGTSISYLPALVMVAYYFDKKRSFATGIATSGSNLGALGLAPLQQVIVDAFGWRNCYRFLSGLALVITVCGLLFKPLDEKKTGKDRLVKSTEITFEKSFKKKLLSFPRNNWFIIWAVASTIATFGYFIPHVHLVRVAEEMGSSHRDGSLLLSYIGIGSGVGKIIFGKISDIPRVDTIKLYNICMVLSGLSPLLAIYSAGYDMLVLYVVVLGLLDGCFIGLMSIVTFQCTDREKMSVAWGAVLMIMSFSMLVGAPAAGWFGETTGKYRNLFFLAGAPTICGAVVFSLIQCIKDPIIESQQKRALVIPTEEKEIIFVYDRLTVV